MKREWKKKIGSILLCAALLCGSISPKAYAVDVSGNDVETAEDKIEEEIETSPESAEKSEEETDGEAVSANDPEDEKSEPEKEESSVSENDPEGDDETLKSVSENDPEKEQYHLIEEDPDSVAKWLDLYCSNGFEELLEQGDAWWDALYEDEREYAEFLVGLIVELSEDVYDGQSVTECVRILESGVDADSFFKGTIFEGLTAEDLKAYCATGDSLEGDGQKVSQKSRQKNRAISLKTEGEGETEGESVKKLVSKVKVTATGYYGTGHGRIYRIRLGEVPALCISCGKHCRNSFLYHADPGTYVKKTGPLGYFAKYGNNSGAEYVACQIAAWLFLENGNLDEVKVKSRAQAMINISSEISVRKMRDQVWRFYSEAKFYEEPYYEYYSDNENAQVLITFEEAKKEENEIEDKDEPAVPEEPKNTTLSQAVEVTYFMEINKRDWQTGVGLSDCSVKIFENGAYLTTVTTDGRGHAKYAVHKSAVFSADFDGASVSEKEALASIESQIAAFAATPYTYSVKEETAPEGYVWEANEKSETITGEETAEFNLTNERTLGAVELIKFDTESESETAQGDAVLDGAVYGIYAGEDIYHQDKKTGRLFKRNELVQTAVTGKTPKRSKDGYLLNTDGSRHIEQPEKEIAYLDTPGRTLFGDLELGSYYIKEITPSEGYMFDEAVYPAAFTYKDQMIKVEKREERAGEANNELTADDGSGSDDVYSGDYVNKQGVQFLKTSDNAWQTELKPIEGAGFSVYLISGLSGVKNGQIKPIGETWTSDDIQTFYDYDFTGEKTAAVYKRTGHETWTAGDKLWLEEQAGENEYRVKEMITDEDGRIETPELPYGTYVIVETSTPEHHTGARPFIVSIRGDGGVLYTDERKREIEKTYDEEERIRYGDHEMTKEREGRVLQKQRIVNNMITKTHLRILKTDEEFTVKAGTYIGAEEFVRGTVLKEGAKYRLKCRTLSFSRDSLLALNWKFDVDGYLSFYDQDIRELTGTQSRPFTTKFLRKNGVIQDCYVMLPQEIPVGTYELEELRAPAGYVVNGWEQFVQDISTDRVNRYEIVDTPFPKAVFTINNGAVYPDGQMGTNKYALTDEHGNLTVTVLQENQEQKGIVEITKHGEQLSGFHEDSKTLLDKLDEETFRRIKKTPESAGRDLVFTYEDAPVEGAVFAIVAAEDIYTQEVQEDLFDSCQVKREQYLIHKKGETVAAITTDRNGWGYAADLYIGKYKIVETTAGNGFVLNTAETEFEITKKEQTVSFDIHTADYRNERQKLEIAVEKKDRETGKPLAGAIYGLYANEDIMLHIEKAADGAKWIIKDAPEILCEKDTLVAACITGDDGKGVFRADLPLGKYYVRELEAPAGYLTAVKDIPVNAGYESVKGGQNVEKQEHCPVFKNRKTQAHIAKQDLTEKQEIAGATLEICRIETDKDGNLRKDAAGSYITKTVESWKSEEKPHLFTGLELEKVYILSEKEAPEGYGYAEDILFKLMQEREDGKLTETAGMYRQENNIWRRCEEDILVMYDERKALDIEKSTIRMTQRGDTYRYTVDKLKNLTEGSLEQFTMTDHLPKGVYLTELWTGTYSESLLYDAEYMTNGSGEWIPWQRGLSSDKNNHLQVPEELQTKEEHIVKFRLCFGAVGGTFEKAENPAYMTYVSSDAEGIISNKIELTAEHKGRKLRDKSETETILYLKRISGYRPAGGKEPLYEIVEFPVEETAEKIRTVHSVTKQPAEEIEQTETETPEEVSEEPQEAEEKKVKTSTVERKVVQTGDDTPFLILAQVAAASAGVLILCFFGKKRKNCRIKRR